VHEPRLRNVRATVVRSRNLNLRVRYHIDAELRVDPAPKVTFETEVELTTGYTSVRETPA
jgi:predicted component of type VI protein secretion system